MPTTVGLDPQARLALWDVLRQLHRAGRTIIMTTHYRQEADELSGRLAIIDLTLGGDGAAAGCRISTSPSRVWRRCLSH